jgi:hypothetical protein
MHEVRTPILLRSCSPCDRAPDGQDAYASVVGTRPWEAKGRGVRWAYRRRCRFPAHLSGVVPASACYPTVHGLRTRASYTGIATARWGGVLTHFFRSFPLRPGVLRVTLYLCLLTRGLRDWAYTGLGTGLTRASYTGIATARWGAAFLPVIPSTSHVRMRRPNECAPCAMPSQDHHPLLSCKA